VKYFRWSDMSSRRWWQVQVVDLIDQHQVGAGVDEYLADRIGDVVCSARAGTGGRPRNRRTPSLASAVILWARGHVDHRDPSGAG